jgi:hypothetical protein
MTSNLKLMQSSGDGVLLKQRAILFAAHSYFTLLRFINQSGIPGEKLTYSWVIGSYKWISNSYISLWYLLSEATQTLLIWINGLWAALFPAAAFGIAQSIIEAQHASLRTTDLRLLDSSASVKTSWLIKYIFWLGWLGKQQREFVLSLFFALAAIELASLYPWLSIAQTPIAVGREP